MLTICWNMSAGKGIVLTGVPLIIQQQQIFVSWGLPTCHMSVFPMNKLSQCRGMIKNLTRTELTVELMV